jgi:hypothetical protein
MSISSHCRFCDSSSGPCFTSLGNGQNYMANKYNEAVLRGAEVASILPPPAQEMENLPKSNQG